MRIAYLDTFSGISGDMTVGALLHLGVPLDALRDAVATLGLPGVELSAHRVSRAGIDATKFEVRVHGQLADTPDPPGTHTHTHVHEHSHSQGHDHSHSHSHSHSHEDARARSHTHRPWAEIRAQLEASRLPEPTRGMALAIFHRLADAEGKVHGVHPDKVEFHEVGALDAIVDVVGAALGFTHLGIERIHVSALPLGQGRTHSAHGPIPVPPPAVVELLRGRPVRLEDGACELVTPTGAAIVAACARPEAVPPMRVEAIGYGAGERTLADRPNLLRILVGEPVETAGADEVAVLEATIDDLNPQLYEHVLERLLAAGARDAFLVPVVMKRSRPATMLRVLAEPADRERLAGIVFAETSTIGLRWTTWRRTVLAREERTVETPWGSVRVKVARAPDGTLNVAPEYEDCRRIASDRGVPLKVVHQAALGAAMLLV